MPQRPTAAARRAQRPVLPIRSFGGALALALLAGCAALAGPDTPRLAPFLGAYQGSFDSALTDDPADDLNYNPCDPARRDCDTHHAPLRDIVLALDTRPGGETGLTFYRDRDDLQRGDPLDLLGRGCGTRIGPLATLRKVNQGSHRWTATFPLMTDNRPCLGKLRPTSSHTVQVELHDDPEGDGRFVRVLIDKQVTDKNYLYVVEDGVERRVRIDVANTVGQGRSAQYRVCIEDDFGEYDRCVLTDREFKSFLLPLPLPGGAAVSYTWWQELAPNLKRTRGLYMVEQYLGRFDALP